MKKWTAVCSMLFFVFVASPAFAESKPTKLYDWPSADVSMAYLNGTDAIFFDKSGKPYRAFEWRGTQGNQFEHHIVIDLNKDETPEFVAAGEPSFVLRSNTDPWWAINSGCDQVLLGDFAADKKLDVLCNKGSSLDLYTHDGQGVWSLTLGRRVDKCRVGDYNGDLKADIECKWLGSEKLVRLDSGGEIIGRELKEHEIPKNAVELKDTRTPLNNLISSNKTLHFSQFSVKVDSKKLKMTPDKKKAKPQKHSFGAPIESIHRKQFGEDKKHLVVVTEKQIALINKKGDVTGTYSTSASRYRRHPVAKLKNVYANGFKKTSDATKAVRTLEERFATCYEDRVRSENLAGVGQILFQMSIDSDGSIKRINTLHSDFGDKTVEKCAKDALRKGNYPGSKKGMGSINLDLQFSFRDK